MGGKYKWKADDNPPVGGYDLESSFNVIYPQNRSVIIKKETCPYRRPKETNPEPGQYDGHLDKFGSKTKSFTIGEKKPATYNQNPGPGYYDPNESITKSKVQFAVIKEDS